MKVPFNLNDFSGGMKGSKGQFNSADLTNVQDLENFLVERNNTLESRNGAVELPFTLLDNDKILPFTYNNKKYYFIYDPLLKLKYRSPTSTALTYSMGGQRFVDLFSKFNSSLYPLDYLSKERDNHAILANNNTNIAYNAIPVGLPTVDDIPKWAEFKDFDTVTANSADYLELHKNLRKLTWESSPSILFSEYKLGITSIKTQHYLITDGHAVAENTFWWNRMFVMDEDFNIITNEIDLANFVSYDSGHELLESINTLDSAVRDSTHAGLQTIREARYGSSDLEYEAAVMNQGVMFYNKEGKLPNMFLLLNKEGQTDGVLRDFRTLYLEEIPNGIFKTAPYFTDAEYAANTLYDEGRLRLEMKYITQEWDVADVLISSADLTAASDLITEFYKENAVTDYANNPRVELSYNVKDPENLSDIVKAFIPLTSDASPAVAIDNIRLDEPDGQVRFMSPSLANLDRDFVFPHDGSPVWSNDDLASELPFIFSPNLVVYYKSSSQNVITKEEVKYSSAIVTLINIDTIFGEFAAVPMSPYTGGAIAKFDDSAATYRPIKITALTNASTVVTADADYLPVAVYTKVVGLFKFDSFTLNLSFEVDTDKFPARLGLYENDGFTVTPIANFKTYTTTYEGYTRTSTSGFFASSSRQEYSFKIYQPSGGSQFSVINTDTMQLSKAIGFNADSYFSSVVEFAGRMFLASLDAPNTLVYSSPIDFLEFSVVRSLVNAENDSVATRGGRETFGNEAIQALHESNDDLRLITDRRIISVNINEEAVVTTSNPSDIVTSGKTPVTVNNFTYFVSGNERDILLSVFSDKTQRFEYYSVFSAINIDDSSKILSFAAIDASYCLVVRTANGVYVGRILQANQVAWSRFTFTFEVSEIKTTPTALYVSGEGAMYEISFVEDSDLEDGVLATVKMLSPIAMGNMFNLPKTNINLSGLRLHDVTVVGDFNKPLRSGSDANPLKASFQGNVVSVHNKNFDGIEDSIELSFSGGKNRIFYIRGSLGV